VEADAGTPTNSLRTKVGAWGLMVSLPSELYWAARLNATARAKAGAGELVAVNAGRPRFTIAGRRAGAGWCR
jgi:hypothetical protein